MDDLWQILALAVVQGVAEFLPISSSGHLVLLGTLMGLEEISDLNIVLHVGTLLSILVFYWRRVLALLGVDRRIAGLLIAGTIPAVVIGVPLKEFAPGWLESPLVTGVMLIITGLMLIFVCRIKPGEREYQDLGWSEAALIGAAQAAAILPGLSRSGSTIAAGMTRQLSPMHATSFSFLLAIPIIAGGGCYELLKQWKADSASATPPAHLLLGAAVAFIVGLGALQVLARVMERGRLDRFAWWCIPVGALTILTQWFL